MSQNTDELELMLQGKLMKRLRDVMFSSLRSRYDLKQVEIEVMVCLHACPEQPAAEIAKKLYLQKGHVSMAMDRLRDKNLITCRRNDTDRRQIQVSLTEAGLELYQEIQNSRLRLNDIMLRGFSEEETDALNAFLKRIADNAGSELRAAEAAERFREVHR